MSIYFISTNESWLREVNGRGFTERHTTKQWGSIYKHPERDEWAVEIPQDYLDRMGEVVSEQELGGNATGPFTREVMEADGWFAESEPSGE